MRAWPTAVWLAVAVALIACSDKRAEPTPPASEAAAMRLDAMVTVTGPSQTSTYWAAQKLIRTAQLRIQVKDVQAAVRTADSLVRQSGALVTESKLSQDAQDRHEAHLVIRVPSDRLGAALGSLRQLGEVKEEAVSTEDITKAYADLETRLSVKEQTVARLRALLENRTAKLADVLEVERELARAVTELEQMKGERRYYDQQIALSTVTLTLVDHATTRSAQFTAPIGAAFREALEVLGRSISVLIYLATFLLPWLLVATMIWALTRWFRGRQGRPTTDA